MRILLDTNVFLRAAFEPEIVGPTALDAIDAAESRFVSLASAWEMAIKCTTGKLRLGMPVGEYVRTRLPRMRAQLLPIDLPHVSAVEALPSHHRDPFDRLIVAQALVEGLTIVSSDRRLEQYGVKVIS